MKHIRGEAIQRACKLVLEWKPRAGDSLGLMVADAIEEAVRGFVLEARSSAFEEAAADALDACDWGREHAQPCGDCPACTARVSILARAKEAS